jgi:hypothetical protein
VGRTVCGLKLLELARAVGMREYATVSMAVKRYAGHLRVDVGAQKELRRIMKMLKLDSAEKPYRRYLAFRGRLGSATRRRRRSERPSNCHCISSPAARSIAAAKGKGILM